MDCGLWCKAIKHSGADNAAQEDDSLSDPWNTWKGFTEHGKTLNEAKRLRGHTSIALHFERIPGAILVVALI